MKNTAERRQSNTDDDDIEEESFVSRKETTKQPHHLPGISIETKPPEPPTKPEKRLSLSEIFEKMGNHPMVPGREKAEKPPKIDDDIEEEEPTAEVNKATDEDTEPDEQSYIPDEPEEDTEVRSISPEYVSVDAPKNRRNRRRNRNRKH